MGAFEEAFTQATGFGQLVGVTLPGGVAPVPPEVLAGLHPSERAAAALLHGRRQIEWVGGRLAARAALRFSGEVGSIDAGEGGEPRGPARWALSISHKPDLAVAVAGPSELGTLGIDLEVLDRPRLAIASHVLTDLERARWSALPDSAQWPELLSVFALKEAIYKALYPHLRRYVAFTEAEIDLGPPPRARLSLVGGPKELITECRLETKEQRVLAFARCRPP